MSQRTMGAAIIFLAAAAGTVETARAQSWADNLFVEHGHDFGPVPRGAVVRHDFVMTNRLKEPLTILDVRASCGCTSGRASATQLAPGQSARVEAQMDTRNFVGRKATKLIITIMTASGQSAEAQVAVVSNILPDIVLNPGTIDFGSLAKGQSPRLSMTIERLGSPEWRFTRMTATGSLLKSVDARLDELERSPSRVAYQLTVTLKPTASAGYLRDDIRILTNDPESPMVPVLVTAQIQGTLTASPSTLAMGRASGGAAQGRFLIRSTKPFAIKNLEGSGDGFTITADDAASKPLHIVTVTYHTTETSMRGDLRRTFQVTSDLADEPPLQLNATLRVDP